MSPNLRLAVGVILMVVGLVLPLGAYPVAQTSWPAAVKAALAGILFFGFEIMAIPAAAIMGKENFDRIVARAKGLVGSMKPAGNVGKVRHVTGLVLFLMPILPTCLMAYMPRYLPDASPERLWVNLCTDLLCLIGLFVLGGDFWDKLRSLFVRESRAVFPEKVHR